MYDFKRKIHHFQLKKRFEEKKLLVNSIDAKYKRNIPPAEMSLFVHYLKTKTQVCCVWFNSLRSVKLQTLLNEKTKITFAENIKHFLQQQQPRKFYHLIK